MGQKKNFIELQLLDAVQSENRQDSSGTLTLNGGGLRNSNPINSSMEVAVESSVLTTITRHYNSLFIL